MLTQYSFRDKSKEMRLINLKKEEFYVILNPKAKMLTWDIIHVSLLENGFKMSSKLDDNKFIFTRLIHLSVFSPLILFEFLFLRS